MITGEIGGLDIYLKKSTELDHISLIFRYHIGLRFHKFIFKRLWHFLLTPNYYANNWI